MFKWLRVIGFWERGLEKEERRYMYKFYYVFSVLYSNKIV